MRRLTDLPLVGHPAQLRVLVPTFRCTCGGCEREVFTADTSTVAQPGPTATRRCARYVLRRLALDQMTVAAVVRELGRSRNTVNGIAAMGTRALLASDTTRLDGVLVIGVIEHRWAHPGYADRFVTVIVDLADVVAGQGPARLVDLVPGRSAKAMADWLAGCEKGFCDRAEVVAMDGFGGHKTAASDHLPDATTMMDPFHVVALAGARRLLKRRCRSGAAVAGAGILVGCRGAMINVSCWMWSRLRGTC